MSTNGTNGHGAAYKKTAIVTGGASGIGLAMARHFASEGYDVALLDVAGEEPVAAALDQVRKAGAEGKGDGKAKVIFRRCDVSSWREQADGFRAVHDEFGRVDVVCANAGISERGASVMAAVEEDEPRQPDLKVVDVCLTGVIYCKSRCMNMRKLLADVQTSH